MKCPNLNTQTIPSNYTALKYFVTSKVPLTEHLKYQTLYITYQVTEVNFMVRKLLLNWYSSQITPRIMRGYRRND
jgi:hypothetical protein